MMVTGKETVAAVLERDQKALEIFVAASPAFERLRNPALRRVMARLVTVEQAAKIAGVDLAGLLARLNRRRGSTATQGSEDAATAPRADAPPAHEGVRPPELRRLTSAAISDVDVREDLRSGREPFSRIMSHVAGLGPGGVLRLRAPFEPVPLYDVMDRRGYAHWTERLASDDWLVWFYRRSAVPETSITTRASGVEGRPVELEPPLSDGSAAFQSRSGTVGNVPPLEPRTAAAGDARTMLGRPVILDVRGMEPPEPLVRTLAALETLPPGGTLLQINVRVPEYLLPHLDRLGYTYEIRRQGTDLVHISIRAPQGRIPEHGHEDRPGHMNGESATQTLSLLR